MGIKLMDFDLSDNKQLVFVKVRFEQEVCMNVITQMGFGKGALKVTGGNKIGVNYMIPPIGRNTIYTLKRPEFKEFLTFSWFRAKIVCLERPHLCNDTEAGRRSGFGISSTSSAQNSFVRL